MTHSIERSSVDIVALVYFTATSPIRALVIIEQRDGRVRDVWIDSYASVPVLWSEVERRTGEKRWIT